MRRPSRKYLEGERLSGLNEADLAKMPNSEETELEESASSR